MRHWGHGHSIFTGLVLGLSLAAHAWLFVIGGIVVGYIARDVWAIRRRIAEYFNRPKTPFSPVATDWRKRW